MNELKQFDLENQVRTIIADLMDPIADRAVKNQSELKKVHSAVDQMHKRLDEVERVMKVDLNLKTFINDIKKRQSLIEQDVRELSQKSQKDYEKMHNDHSSQNDKYTTFMKEKLIYQHERDHMVQEIKKIETSVSNWEHRMTEDINSHKIHFNNQVEDIHQLCSHITIDNSTTRSLVKHQTEQFATIHSGIEINKASIDRLARKIESLPVISELEQTEQYLNKYIQFKIQNMIDDTLFSVLGPFETSKLLSYEQQLFTTLTNNVKTVESKLYKQEMHIPSVEERQKMLKFGINTTLKGLQGASDRGNNNSKLQTLDGMNTPTGSVLGMHLDVQIKTPSRPVSILETKQEATYIQSLQIPVKRTASKLSHRSNASQLSMKSQQQEDHPVIREKVIRSNAYESSESNDEEDNIPFENLTEAQKKQRKIKEMNRKANKNTVMIDVNMKKKQPLFGSNKRPDLTGDKDAASLQNENQSNADSNFVPPELLFTDQNNVVGDGVVEEVTTTTGKTKKVGKKAIKFQYQQQSDDGNNIEGNMFDLNNFIIQKQSPLGSINGSFQMSQKSQQHQLSEQKDLTFQDGTELMMQSIEQNILQQDHSVMVEGGSQLIDKKTVSSILSKASKEVRAAKKKRVRMNLPGEDSNNDDTDEFTEIEEEVEELVEESVEVIEEVDGKEVTVIRKIVKPVLVKRKVVVLRKNIVQTTTVYREDDLNLYDEIHQTENNARVSSFNVSPPQQQQINNRLNASNINQSINRSQISYNADGSRADTGYRGFDNGNRGDTSGYRGGENGTKTQQELDRIQMSVGSRAMRDNNIQKQMQDEYFALQQQQLMISGGLQEAEALHAIENPHEFMIESYQMVKELQLQSQNMNQRLDLTRKEVQTVKQEAIQEDEQLILNFNLKLQKEMAHQAELLEDIRGELAEANKQRKRERADLMSEMKNVIARIDKGKEEYECFNQLLQVLNVELGAVIKVLKMQQCLDTQDEIDREAIFLMGMKENLLPQTSESPDRLPQIQGIESQSRRTLRETSNKLGIPQQQVISLDKNCLTCSNGGVPFAMNAFKIACLQYTPSVVQIEQGTLPRKQLIEIKGQLIDICGDNLDNYDTNIIKSALKKFTFFINNQKGHSNRFQKHKMQLSKIQTNTSMNISQAGFDMAGGFAHLSSNDMIGLSKLKMRGERTASTINDFNQSGINILESIRSRESSQKQGNKRYDGSGANTDRYNNDTSINNLKVQDQRRFRNESEDHSPQFKTPLSKTTSNFHPQRNEIVSQSIQHQSSFFGEIKATMEGHRMKILQRHRQMQSPQ